MTSSLEPPSTHIPNDIDCLHWVNENLIECMKDTTGVTELNHKTISLGANLEVYYPSWMTATELENNMSKECILEKLKGLD